MLLKKKWPILLMAIAVLFTLVACSSGSDQSKVLGSWKVIVGDRVISYMDINEERYTIRSGDDTPMTAEYKLTETQDDSFIMEAVNPENGSMEFLFEGSFENKDKIKVLRSSNGAEEKSELIRVDSIVEEMKKDKKKSQEKAKQEAKKEEEKRLQQEEKDNELAKEKEKAKQRTAEVNGLKKNYLQKADNLENGITNEAKKLYAQDTQPGFYGQYFSEWDDLLNEVWDELKTTMQKTEFEKLKLEQNEWIKMKEENFAEIPKEPASERARGMDYLASETKDRVYYLIKNYLE